MHADLLERWRQDLSDVIGLMNRELKRYRAAYEADFLGTWQVATPEELTRAVARSDVIVGGDYHTLPAAQRLPVRLLRGVLERDRRPTTLALEMLHSQDQPLVDRYLAGRLGLQGLKRAIAFDRRWGFDWLQYSALLRFARRESLHVLGINCEPGVARGRLDRRDEHAARVIAEHLQAEPGRRVYVIAGDWHVARAHLPRLIRAEAARRGRAPRLLIVHQNHDGLRERLAPDLRGRPAAARRGRDLFCVFNATPLVKIDSHRNWISRQQETARPGGKPLDADEWSLFDPISAWHEVEESLRRHLGIPLHEINWTVRSAEDEIGLLGAARRAGAPAATRRRWLRRLAQGRLVWVAAARTLLVGPAPVHRLAEAAAWRLLSLRPRRRLTPVETFYRRAIETGAAFFASRLFNPDRKCLLPADLATGGHRGSAAGWTAAWIRRQGRQPDPPFADPLHPFWSAAPGVRRRCAGLVGTTWGYFLFDAYARGEVEAGFLHQLFREPLEGSLASSLFRRGREFWPADAATASKDRLL